MRKLKSPYNLQIALSEVVAIECLNPVIQINLKTLFQYRNKIHTLGGV